MTSFSRQYLLEETRRFCEVDFLALPYVALERRDQAVRHVLVHVAGLVERVVELGTREPRESHILKQQTVGDIGLYRSILMNEFDELLPFHVPETDAIRHIACALGGLKRYIEPREHGAYSPEEQIVEVAIPHLDGAQRALADAWDIDADDAQRRQMHRPQLGVSLVGGAPVTGI